jgi:hypothetical protein
MILFKKKKERRIFWKVIPCGSTQKTVFFIFKESVDLWHDCTYKYTSKCISCCFSFSWPLEHSSRDEPREREPCPSQNRKVMTSGLIARRLYGPNNSSSDRR